MNTFFKLIILLLLTFWSPSQAGPRLLPFQGRLGGQKGFAVPDGPRLFQFRLFDQPLDGANIWAGEVHRATVNDGLVNVILGTKASLDAIDFNRTLYLAIVVDANGDNQITADDPPLWPRQAIIPVIFAQEAGNSSRLGGYDWTVLFGQDGPAKGFIDGQKLAKGSVTINQLEPSVVAQFTSSQTIVDLQKSLQEIQTFKEKILQIPFVTQELEIIARAGTNNSITTFNGIELLPIRAGSFKMGSPPEEQGPDDERPQVMVTISKLFWMGKTEVTQDQYNAVMGTNANPSFFRNSRELPVESVTWHEANRFCALLTAGERDLKKLPDNYVYRLPTEAEWEYACRADTKTRFSYGDDPDFTLLGDFAWYSANGAGETHPVHRKLQNPWNLFDMHGNVYEWCLDYYVQGAPYAGGTDPRGPISSPQDYRVFRGGAYYFDQSYARSASRNFGPAGSRERFRGFRVVLGQTF